MDAFISNSSGSHEKCLLKCCCYLIKLRDSFFICVCVYARQFFLIDLQKEVCLHSLNVWNRESRKDEKGDFSAPLPGNEILCELQSFF